MDTAAKRRVTLALDADLVEALETGGDDLAASINTALREYVAKTRRHDALGRLLDRLDAESGPLDSAEDRAEIARYMVLLGGEPDADVVGLSTPKRR